MQKKRDVRWKWVPIDSIFPYEKNARIHDAAQLQQIADSIAEFGWQNAILVDKDMTIIAGHGRQQGGKLAGATECPIIVADNLSAAQVRLLRLADNKIAENSAWDESLLAIETLELRDMGVDMGLTGFDSADLDRMINELTGAAPINGGGEAAEPKGDLAAKFGIAPFTVLNAREGWWQERKRAWLDLGIKSELGRDAEAYPGQDRLNAMMGDKRKTSPGGSPRPSTTYSKDKARGSGTGKAMPEIAKGLTYGTMPMQEGMGQMSGTSIFDPVLCELSYRWFSPVGGTVLDPFAGGSVRGIVAGRCGRDYVGVDLRKEQVMANRAQGKLAGDAKVSWRVGDSRDIGAIAKGVKADMIFSCPPYADLEVYSDDPQDLSTLAYPKFRDAYFEIIAEACKLLKDDRFACFVVGDVRGKDGAYYNFVGDTVEAFKAAGLAYYNEAILVTMVGSLPIRAGKQFAATRKLGKTHQNVLVFVKGNAKKATEACGICDFGAIEPDVKPEGDAAYGEVLEAAN